MNYKKNLCDISDICVRFNIIKIIKIFAKYNILIYLCIETNTKYTMFGFESTPSKLSGSLAREARAKMKRVRNNCLTDSEKEQVARNIAGIKKYNVIWK